MKNKGIHVVFSGGGTGGHLFPGLAVAEQLAAMIPLVRITFCGGGKPFERESVSRAGFEYFALPARPLPSGAREAVSFVVENLAGYLAAGRFLGRERVAAVVGLGGYASVPMAHAAARRRVPLVLLEQNVVPGKATRWLARRASLVCTTFEETRSRLRCGCPVRVTGNPIRAGFVQEGGGRKAEGGTTTKSEIRNPKSETKTAPSAFHLPPSALRPPPSQLLVLGGSGGARALNESVPRAIYKIRRQLQGRRIVHQSGQSGLEVTQSLYGKLDLAAAVVPFVRDMPAALGGAELAVCRAGGTTLAELAAAGVPAVLLPYPHATDDHQLANAKLFSAGGGCVTIDQREVVGQLDDHIADVLCFLLGNDGLRRQMSAAMRKMARPSAAEDVAELIWSIVSSRALRSELAAA
jgi:UDP-N-acetylglucosamine--N-acetylmuramyl-(pentapeptide) pyrophosphoryl-undecaprenol N-acetylglucosamine transferase